MMETMRKILVVDDDIDILNLLKITLALYRYQVQGISNWQNIDNSIETFQPDLVLLDVSLGTADGRDICRRLKSDEKTRRLPVVLFSANVEVEKNWQGVQAQAFIPKPYNLDSLLQTLDTVINESKK